MRRLGGALAALVTGVAATLVVIALAIIPFLNPVWVAFGQERAEAAAWTGFGPAELRTVTDAILADLVIGPPAFDVSLDGVPVLNEREREHMRDVRTVFGSFFLVAVASLVVLVGAWVVARGPAARARFWHRLAATGVAIAVGTVVVGVAGVVFFDAAFELFHRLFFPAGTYLFDPRTERLVQLFPEQFWVESTIGVGVVVIGLGLLLALVARRRVAVLEHRIAGEGRAAAGPAVAR